MLSDSGLVCDVRDISIQRRLLAEPKLTLKRAVHLALAIEAADKDASEIQKGDSQVLCLTKLTRNLQRVAI